MVRGSGTTKNGTSSLEDHVKAREEIPERGDRDSPFLEGPETDDERLQNLQGEVVTSHILH